jgi:hypothetical protein
MADLQTLQAVEEGFEVSVLSSCDQQVEIIIAEPPLGNATNDFDFEIKSGSRR